jgi:Zinc dependent phospholipase C
MLSKSIINNEYFNEKENRNLKNRAFSQGFRLTLLPLCLFLITTAFATNSWAWSNGGYSTDPTDPDYGTHDWLAQHAIDWLPPEEKKYILDNLASYLYGTELPDNNLASDGIHDTTKHHIYYNSEEAMTDDAAATRASTEYNNALNSLKAKDYAKAAKNTGIMTHYIADMAVFGHVMGATTDWGAETHHSDYETYIDTRTSTFNAEFNSFLSFDGSLNEISAYEAARKLAYDTTFDTDGTLTCSWMDQNYDWTNPTFKNRAGESLNLAANYLADVLHTLYQESSATTPPIAEAAIAATLITASGLGSAYVLRKRKKRKRHLNTTLNNTTMVEEMERKEKRPKFWEQQTPVQTRSMERTYRCPQCNEFLFSVPLSWPVPTETTEVTCPNGHRVTVPKFPPR